MSEAKTIDEQARSCVMELMHSHEPREAIIAKHMRLVLVAIAGPMAGELQDIADALGGATEGSEEMEQLARIGEVVMAYDAAVGT